MADLKPQGLVGLYQVEPAPSPLTKPYSLTAEYDAADGYSSKIDAHNVILNFTKPLELVDSHNVVLGFGDDADTSVTGIIDTVVNTSFSVEILGSIDV